MSTKTGRNIKADIIRGFAIITVVAGHCIQHGNGLAFYEGSRYWSDKLYQFIYSFHMPLFMLLAGWFAYFSMKKLEGDRRKQWSFLGKRVITYVTPIFLWTVFEFVRGYLINKKLGNETIGFPEIIPQFLTYFITNLWFLWAVLVCLFIVFVMHFYLKDNVILYALGFLALFVLPDGYNLGVYKFLMPYYIGAFYVNMYKDRLAATSVGKKTAEFYRSKRWLYLVINGIIFAGLFVFYDERAFIYLSGYKLTTDIWYKQLIVDLYRMIIGFVGSGFFIILFDMLTEAFKNYKWPVLTTFGKNSLGVYILQGYFILIGMVRITNDLEPDLIRVFVETVCICAISLITTMIVDKIPIIRCLVGKPFLKKEK